MTTLAAGLAEPSGASSRATAGRRRVRRAPADPAAARGGRRPHRRLRAPHPAPGHRGRGALELVVAFEPPPGQKVDDRFGPPSQLVVEATPPALIRDGDGRGTDLTRTLELDPQVGEGVLHVAARAASCDDDGGEGAACRMHQQDWGVPVRVSAAGDAAWCCRSAVRPAAVGRCGVNERRVGPSTASTSDGSGACCGGVSPPHRRRRCGGWTGPPVDSEAASGRPLPYGGPLFFEARCRCAVSSAQDLLIG